ncbi:MAG: YbjN domain-containing protein [Acidimicrobiales bacterium]
MTRAPLGDSESARRLDDTIRSWADQWSVSALLGIEHQALPDDRGHHHWLIRLSGEEKDVITLWLSLRQRTVHAETEVVPAPEENLEAFYKFLLVKNAELRELHLAIGPEEGIYLQCQIPTNEVTVERLDELVGATLHYVDEIYPTAMTMALPSLYRRRKTS